MLNGTHDHNYCEHSSTTTGLIFLFPYVSYPGGSADIVTKGWFLQLKWVTRYVIDLLNNLCTLIYVNL